MKDMLKMIGNIAAVAGVLVCAVSGGARLLGLYYVVGFESMTLFNVGIALMVAAILAKVEAQS